MQIKVGVQLASLRLPFKKALLTAAELGADAVEIDARNQLIPADMTSTAVRQVRKMLDDLNLRVCAVSFRTRRGYNVLDQLEQRVEATKRAMDFAYQLGANVVVNQIGRVPEEPEGPDWNLLTETLADIGRYGQHVGAMMAAETGTESGEHLGRLIKALPIGSLVVNFDPGNLIVNDHSPSDALSALAEHVHYVHANDGVRDLAQGRGIEVALGRGSADLPELLAVLEEQRYSGYFTVGRRNSDNAIFEIGEAVKYLRNI
ncbi:MAG: sugar phosphate isomerase/epimerase [Pirellulaceae bacterium]|jgi:sugar phosphate isomerase/epimerase